MSFMISPWLDPVRLIIPIRATAVSSCIDHEFVDGNAADAGHAGDEQYLPRFARNLVCVLFHALSPLGS